MSTNPLSQLDVTTLSVKRAQYEAFEFSLVPDGVRVQNNSHANPENHEYTVTVQNGLPTTCTCPADANYPSACKHRIAVAIRRPILDAVAQQRLLTDGGARGFRSTDNQTHAESDADPECDCVELRSDLSCWECFREERHADRE